MRSIEVIPATERNLAVAREFVLRKWKERAQELGKRIPDDLSGSCKFTSLFALNVFDGVLRGNFFHQWIELDGLMIDLNEDAMDVADLVSVKVPPAMSAYATASRRKVPEDLYTNDPVHMASRGQRESMASVIPRVDHWVAEFRALLAASVDAHYSNPHRDI